MVHSIVQLATRVILILTHKYKVNLFSFPKKMSTDQHDTAPKDTKNNEDVNNVQQVDQVQDGKYKNEKENMKTMKHKSPSVQRVLEKQAKRKELEEIMFKRPAQNATAPIHARGVPNMISIPSFARGVPNMMILDFGPVLPTSSAQMEKSKRPAQNSTAPIHARGIPNMMILDDIGPKSPTSSAQMVKLKELFGQERHHNVSWF